MAGVYRTGRERGPECAHVHRRKQVLKAMRGQCVTIAPIKRRPTMTIRISAVKEYGSAGIPVVRPEDAVVD